MLSLRNIRKEIGLSQEALALMLEVPRTSLSMYEQGKRPLPVEVISKLYELYQKFKAERENPAAQNLLPLYDDFKRNEILRLKNEEENKLMGLEARLTILTHEKKELENALLTLTIEKNGEGITNGLDAGLDHKRMLMEEKLMFLSLEVEVSLPVEIEGVRRRVEVLDHLSS